MIFFFVVFVFIDVFHGTLYTMFINEVTNNAELSAIIVNELRDLYGIKFRKEKKLKSHQVKTIKYFLILNQEKIDDFNICKFVLLSTSSNWVIERYLACHWIIWNSLKWNYRVVRYAGFQFLCRTRAPV